MVKILVKIPASRHHNSPAPVRHDANSYDLGELMQLQNAVWKNHGVSKIVDAYDHAPTCDSGKTFLCLPPVPSQLGNQNMQLKPLVFSMIVRETTNTYKYVYILTRIIMVINFLRPRIPLIQTKVTMIIMIFQWFLFHAYRCFMRK